MHKNTKLGLIAITTAGLLSGAAMAGTGGTEFSTALTTVTDWVQGDLGKLIAVVTLVVGLAVGIIQQTIIAVVVSVAMALALYYGPTILLSMISGTLPIT